MRDYIFEFRQEKALEFGLKLNELLLLDYMLKFFTSDQIRKKQKGERLYCKLTYNKVLTDLPILRIKERQLRNMIIQLENKGFVERLSELKNKMYLYVDFDKLLGTDLLFGSNGQATNFLNVGRNLPTIDNYNINKIKINITNTRIQELDLDLFNNELHKLLKEKVSKVSYDLFFQTLKACTVDNDGIIFDAKYKDQIEKSFMNKFISVVNETVSKLV